jgi:hypothetical protein
MITIGIPTIKDNVNKQIEEIKNSTEIPIEVIATCKKQSASLNRNEIIDKAKYDLIILTDDDCENYYKDWVKDLLSYWDETKMNMLSVRTIKPDGSLCILLGDGGGIISNEEPIVEAIHTKQTGLNICGSATIMFKKTHIRYDTNFKACTYEDSSFCLDLNEAFPHKKIYICNKVKIVHRMEAKGRGSRPGLRDNWAHNRDYFHRKHGILI